MPSHYLRAMILLPPILCEDILVIATHGRGMFAWMCRPIIIWKAGGGKERGS